MPNGSGEYGVYEIPEFRFKGEFSRYPQVTKLRKMYLIDGTCTPPLASMATIAKCPRTVRKQYPKMEPDEKYQHLIDAMRAKLEYGFFDSWINLSWRQEHIIKRNPRAGKTRVNNRRSSERARYTFVSDYTPMVSIVFQGQIPVRNQLSEPLNLFGFYLTSIFDEQYYFYYGVRESREEAEEAVNSFSFYDPISRELWEATTRGEKWWR